MTDAQMLQNLLAVYEGLVVVRNVLGWAIVNVALSTLKEVIAELRRRIEVEGTDRE